MNDNTTFERFVADQFAREGRPTPAGTVHDDILSRVSQARQRPRWLAFIKEPPMRLSSSLAVGSPTARVAAIMVATLLLALLVAGAGIAGSRLLATDGTIVVDQNGGGTVETITAAVALAEDGDRIFIRPGTYTETITGLLTEPIIVEGSVLLIRQGGEEKFGSFLVQGETTVEPPSIIAPPRTIECAQRLAGYCPIPGDPSCPSELENGLDIRQDGANYISEFSIIHFEGTLLDCCAEALTGVYQNCAAGDCLSVSDNSCAVSVRWWQQPWSPPSVMPGNITRADRWLLQSGSRQGNTALVGRIVCLASVNAAMSICVRC